MNACRIVRALLVLLIALPLLPLSLRAQRISVSFEAAPLASALEELDFQADETLVYSSRLVRDRYSTCTYAGNDFAGALRCVLEGTGLTADRVRRNQYVVTTSVADSGGASGVRRGSVNGYVMDGASGEVLPGAHVYLADLGAGTISNSAGYFAFSPLPEGAYRARVSFVGYGTVERTLVVGGAPAEIRLQPAPIEAELVVVEDAADRMEPVEPGVVTVPVQQLEAMPSFPGEQDLLQALQWMPGIRKSGEITGDLLVRGGEPDQNLYLLEGAPIYHPWHAFSLISTFQTETFKNVRLYRGGFPAEYGGRLSSVLDAQMKDGRRSEARGVVGLSFVTGRFVVESPVGDKGSMMLSARRSYLDKILGRRHPVESADGRRDTLRTGYYFYDVSTKWSYRPSTRHQFSLAYYEGTDDLDLRLPFDVSLTVGSWLRPADLFFEIDQVWGNRVVSLKHNYLASSRLFMSSTLYYSGYSAHEQALMRPTSTSFLGSLYDVRLDEFGLRSDADFYWSIDHQVRGGVQLMRRHFESVLDARIHPTPGSADATYEESRMTGWEVAAYAQDAWRPTRNWNVLVGLRGSYFMSGRHLDLTPSVAIFRRLHPALVWRSSAGMQVQYLHRLRDRHSFMYDLVSSRWIPADDSVKPSRSTQISTGIEFDVGHGLTTHADVYFRGSRDVLVPRDAYRTKDGLDGPGIHVGALLGQYAPADGRAYGIELGARFARSIWDVFVNYSGGRTLLRLPEIDAESFHASRYDVPRSLRGVAMLRPGPWTFTVSADVRSGYPLSMPEARYEIGDPLDEDVRYLYRPELNNGRLPAYARIDVATEYRFRLFKASWRANLHLYNTLNRRNVVSRSFDPTGAVVTVTDRRGLPLLPLLELEVEF